MRVQTVLVVALVLLASQAGGCSGGGTVEPAVARGPLRPATQPVAVGRIDDDSEPEEPENAVVTAAMAPVRGVGGFFEWIGQELKLLEGDTPKKAAQMTLDTNSADNRRKGLFKLVDYPFAHKPPYTTRYEQMARNDPDATVRAAALRACNWARDRNATGLFASVLADSKEPDAVRLEAAKGLCNLPDPAAVPTLLGVVNSPEINRDIRIACTDALKYYRSLEVGRALGNLLADRDFAVAWQARRSLVYMTHRDYRMDQGAWLGYIAGPEKPLE